MIDLKTVILNKNYYREIQFTSIYLKFKECKSIEVIKNLKNWD